MSSTYILPSESYSNPVYTDLLDSDSYYSEIPESWNPRPGQNLPDHKIRTTGSSVDTPEVIVGQATGNESGYEQLRVLGLKIENPPSTIVSRIEQKGRVVGEEGCCRRHRCCIGCCIGSSITIFVIGVVVTVVLAMMLGGNRDNQQATATTTTTTLIMPNDYRPRDCNDVLSNNRSNSISGVYRVYPGNKSAKDVFCDMETPGGPWLVFQRRQDGSVDFFKNWKNYTDGFGDLNGEFWLGNENLYLLTSTGRYKLRIELEDWEGNKRYATYRLFSIYSSDDQYRLEISGGSGDAGSDGLSYHDGERFSTKDADHDSSANHCAQNYRGGWWYNDCEHSNLNGLYLNGTYTTPEYAGIAWFEWLGLTYSLKTTEMKINRRIDSI